MNRNRARSEIMAGNVFIDGRREDKPGKFVSPAAPIELRQRDNPYVSRGGLKLKKALQYFAVDLHDKVVLDIGASTGGFTQCSLEAGAREVVALDVGYGQLAWNLRNDARVVNMERFNARYLTKDNLPKLPQVATIDVSFISLEIILPVVAALGTEEIICLAKPQFEAIPALVGKNGVVKDPEVHVDILIKLVLLARRLAYTVKGITFSPIKGPKGNIEYFLYLCLPRGNDPACAEPEAAGDETAVRTVVSQAWETLQQNR